MATPKGIKVSIWIFAGFQQMDRQGSQNLNIDTFFKPPVTSAHVVFGTERYPDNSLSLNYDNYDYTQAYGHIKKLSRL